MNKFIILFLSICSVLGAYAQNGVDAEIITEIDRSIPPSYRIANRPQLIDTTITSPVVKYPLLALQQETEITIDTIKPANIRMRPQLSRLYNSYVKIGAGSRLQALGEVYVNSLRSRKFNWGVHARHHSEWGKIKDYAPSQYDNTSIKAFGKVEEKRYSYGGGLNYGNQGLHYYGFRNPDADKDSIRQRFQDFGFNAFYDSHVKDSAKLNFRIGVNYDNFRDRKPDQDSLKDWRGKENYVGLKTRWQYNGSSNKLLSNLRADLDISYNDYRYGIADSVLPGLDTGFVSKNTLIQLRPVTSFYGLGEKLQFKVGLELALDIRDKFTAGLYPIAEVTYSLFNDIFIPYIGVEGGTKQQRFKNLANKNEFIGSNHELRNLHLYEAYFGIKGTISSQVSFNANFKYAHLRDYALFVNDTIYSAGNQFRTVYDTISRATISASISYQQNEKLKIDLIGRFHSYQAKNNPYAWNLPQFEIITRGTYNIADKLITRIDFTLETGRRARVFDPTMEGVEEQDNIYFKKLGVIADANIGIEFRYSERMSIFLNFNNVAAQNYKRWFGYPVNRFQAMGGLTFRF